MKITGKTTVEQLKNFLNANYKGVESADKALAESIAYAAKQMNKDPKSVKKSDLADLARQTIKLLGDKVVEAVTPQPKLVVAENSTKPQGGKLKAGAKKSDPKPEEPKKEPEKQPAPKEEPKKEEPKKPKPEVMVSATADTFPKEIPADGGKLVLAEDILTYEAFKEACANREQFMFAFYWTKKYIKQFQYGSGYIPAPKEGFALDLDLASPIYFGEVNDVAYCASAQTDVLYQVMPEAFDVYDGVRYNMGIECQLYRYVEEAVPAKK